MKHLLIIIIQHTCIFHFHYTLAKLSLSSSLYATIIRLNFFVIVYFLLTHRFVILNIKWFIHSTIILDKITKVIESLDSFQTPPSKSGSTLSMSSIKSIDLFLFLSCSFLFLMKYSFGSSTNHTPQLFSSTSKVNASSVTVANNGTFFKMTSFFHLHFPTTHSKNDCRMLSL